MSDNDKYRFLCEIIEKVVGVIIPTQNYYKESIESLNGYEYIVNYCLEEMERHHKLYKSNYYSEKQVGEKVHEYLLDLKEWIDDVLEQ